MSEPSNGGPAQVVDETDEETDIADAPPTDRSRAPGADDAAPATADGASESITGQDGGARSASSCELATWPTAAAGGTLHAGTNAPPGSPKCALEGVWDVLSAGTDDVGIVAFGKGAWTSRADQTGDLCEAEGTQRGTFGFDGDYLVFVGGSGAFAGCLQTRDDTFVALTFAADCASMTWRAASHGCEDASGAMPVHELRRKR